MPRPSRRAASLAFLLAVIASWPAGRAEAGFVVGAPKIKTGGDPYHIYSVPIFLTQQGDTISPVSKTGLNLIDPGKDDFLTIYNILGYSSSFGLFADSDLKTLLPQYGTIAKDAGSGFTPTGQEAPSAQPDSADISLFIIKGNDPFINPGPAGVLLGYLGFASATDEGVPPTSILEYTWQDHNGGVIQNGHGTAAPEPASIAMLILGSGLVCGAVRSRRKAQAARAG